MSRNPIKTGSRALRSRQRILDAIELRRTTDMTWDEIAAETGYANGPSANKTVRAFIDRQTSEAVEEYRTLLLMRQEKLYQSFIAQAVDQKDLKAAEYCRQIIKDMAQIAGVKHTNNTLNLQVNTGPQIFLPKAGELETEPNIEVIDGKVVVKDE